MLEQHLNQDQDELKRMASQAVDLGRADADRKAEQAAKERAAEAAATLAVARWEKAMNRAFKGIVPRPTRRAMMVRAAERVEASGGLA